MSRAVRVLTVFAHLLLPAGLTLFSCGSPPACPDGDFIGDGDQSEADLPDESDRSDTSDSSEDGDDEIALPRLTDWECPPEWLSVPAFVDEDGNEDVPEGMHQYTICEPPEYWSGPSGPVRLKSWECPKGWVSVVHDELTDENGLPFSWCEPPRLARLFVPGGNEDGTDYLTPLSEGEDPVDYQVCDLSRGMMPELWGSGCVHIGDACPAGDFPTIPAEVSGNRVYVKAGAVQGDGTVDRPWGTIREAVLNSAEGDVLVLGPGTYRERITPTTSRTVWGACVERVTVAGPSGGPAIRAYRSLILRNVTVAGDGTGVEATGPEARLSLTGVAIHRVRGYGLLVQFGQATMQQVTVFGTRSSGGRLGRGFETGNGAQTVLSDALFEHNRDVGIIVAGDGTEAGLSRLAVRGTRPIESGENAGLFGRGIDALLGARVNLISALLADNHETGILVQGAGTQATLSDVAVRGTRPQAGGPDAGRFGRGVVAAESAAVEASGLLLSGNHEMGCASFNQGTRMHLNDIVVRGTLPDAIDHSGWGLEARSGSMVSAARAIFERNQSAGVHATGSGSTLELSDLVVRQTRPVQTGQYAGIFGWGAGIELGARAELQRAIIDRNTDAGVYAWSPGTAAVLSDVAVVGTLAGELAEGDSGTEGNRHVYGSGLIAEDGASLSVSRSLLSGNERVGVIAAQTGTKIVLTDVTVRDNRSVSHGSETGMHGRGITVAAGAEIDVTRGSFDHNREGGIFVFDHGSKVVMLDAVVRHGQVHECSLLPPDSPFYCEIEGHQFVSPGLGVFLSGRIEAQRFLVFRNAILGIQISRDGSMTLEEGVVAGHEIGVNLSVEGYDLTSLQRRVLYRNRRNLSGDDLPVPDPAIEISSHSDR